MIVLTLRDLQHRWVRFVIVTVLAAVVFALLFVMSGMVEQFHREPEDAVAAFGATGWVVPDEEVILIGAPAEGLGAAPTVEGRPAERPGEVVIDDSLGLEVGDEVIIAGQPFDVVGETSDTTVLAGLAFAYVTVPEAQQLTFGTDQAISTVLTTGYRSSPPGTTALSNEQVEQATLDPLDQAITSIDLVRVLLWIMAAIIIGSVVYLSARERDRDIAVLTAVGASKRALLGSLALQAVAIAIAATAVAAVGQMFLADLFPLRIRVPGRAFWQLPTVAVVVALAASAVGMRRVARSDPALAFAGGA
jgi:putative ABC transport system permease protein